MKNEMFAVEIDHHRGGRVFAMQGGWTTTNVKQAFRRKSRQTVEQFAKLFQGKNPSVVSVA